MDTLLGLLDGPRARGAFMLRTSMDPPWAIRVQDLAPLTVVALVRGEAWVVPGRGDPTRLGPGDVAIMRGPEPYTMAGDPATPPRILIQPGQRCTTPDGRDLWEELRRGVRTWGNSPDGAMVMLTGTYRMDTEVSRRLLDALPGLLLLPDGSWDCPLVPLLADEIVKDELGQEVVLDRLLDLLLIAMLRAWFARPEAAAPGWYRAQGDPVVGRALRLLHDNPAHPWTVAALAAAAGVSRASLARRFGGLVGEPPMAYLTGLRLALAADLLTEPGATLGSVARKVGYGSSFALSTAFKRVRGQTPREHRTR